MINMINIDLNKDIQIYRQNALNLTNASKYKASKARSLM